MLNPFVHWIEARGVLAPWLFVAIFVVASLLMIWRLEAMSAAGFEGTVLGTLVMPYCSGLGNLLYAFLLARHGGDGADVMMNSLVNNVTNMTLILGVPAVIFGLNVAEKKNSGDGKKKKSGKTSGSVYQVNRLSLLMTMLAIVFFTGAVWALGSDGKIIFKEGLVLVGLFLFWQLFHVFEVLKQNARQGHSPLGWMFPVDMALLMVGAYGIYVSTDWLVSWVSNLPHCFIKDHQGFFSGWLMVLPNGILAVYYSLRRQPEVVYASQVGDAHVSIPLCVGIFALYRTMPMPPFFETGIYILMLATFLHLFCVALLGRLPRIAGLALIAAYGWFCWKGLLN